MSATALDEPGLAAALGLVLVAVALAGCAQSPPPENPSELDYIYRADHPETAPHPVAFDGAYRSLEVHGAALTVPVEGEARVPAPDDASGVEFEAELVVRDARGTFVPDQGNETRIENETVLVADETTFTVGGLEAVTAVDHTFADGLARSHGTPVEVESGSGPETALRVGGGGATVADVRVTVDPGRGPGGDGEPGTLELRAGNYSFDGGPVAVPDPGTLDLPDEEATVTVAPDGAPVTLRGEDRTPDRVRLDAREVTGAVDVGADRATLDLQVVQWFASDRPWFEADFQATFEDGSREQSVTLEEGENETYWVEGSEVGEVGTAVAMRPRVDEGELRATFGVEWYEDTDPHPLRQAADAFGAAFESFFQDPATRTFDPGETLYIPFVVGAPNGTDPGPYQVQGWVHGENAKSDRVTVDVTVVEG